MSEFSRADVPLSSLNDDALDLRKYARALATFVLNCETPMTVGIQGAWGSGKTSLMNMVRESIQTQKGVPPNGPPWIFEFGTWQYGAIGDDSVLGARLISKFISEISERHKSDGFVARIGAGIAKFTRLFVKPAVAGAVNLASQGYVDGGTLVGDGEFSSVGAVDLSQLKTEFGQLIQHTVRESKKDSARFILFIDDLDRVRPEAAVALLEVLKNFMDVPHCVFVIACDYEVVKRGVQTRFGITEDIKARAFFDKIIQVPFQMPVSGYKLAGLLERFFKRKLTGKNAEELAQDHAKRLEELVATATGTNPRALKRFLNSLDLHASLSEQTAGGKASVWSTPKATRALVGLVALQTGWPAVAAHFAGLQEQALIDAIEALAGEMNSEDERASEDLRSSVREDIREDASRENALFEFAAQLRDALDHDKDGKLSTADVQELRAWSKELSLTQVLRAPAARSPWSLFEAKLASHRAQPVAIRLAYAIQAIGTPINIQRTADKFTVQVAVRQKSITVLVIAPDTTILSLSHNLVPKLATKYDLQSFAAIGDRLDAETTNLGITWTQTGQTSRWTDLNALSLPQQDGLERAVINAVREVSAEARKLNQAGISNE